MKREHENFTDKSSEHNSSVIFSDTTELSFEDFKNSLGPAKDNYSDEEIERMRIVCDKIADIAFNEWLYSRKAA